MAMHPHTKIIFYFSLSCPKNFVHPLLFVVVLISFSLCNLSIFLLTFSRCLSSPTFLTTPRALPILFTPQHPLSWTMSVSLSSAFGENRMVQIAQQFLSLPRRLHWFHVLLSPSFPNIRPMSLRVHLSDLFSSISPLQCWGAPRSYPHEIFPLLSTFFPALNLCVLVLFHRIFGSLTLSKIVNLVDVVHRFSVVSSCSSVHCEFLDDL